MGKSSTANSTRTQLIKRGKRASPRANEERSDKHPQLVQRGTDPGYLIGYARPPKHTQFRPGQSGNPSGGRKKRESLQEIVVKVLIEKVELQIGKRTEKIPGVTGLIRTAMSRALQGDYKFLMAVIAIIRLSGLSDAGADALTSEVDGRADEVILADFLKRHGFSGKASLAGESKDKKLV